MNNQKSTPYGTITGKEQSEQPASSSNVTIPRRRRPNSSMVQNVLLIWLVNNSVGEHGDESCNTITQLHRVVDSVNKFTDCDQCIDFLTDIHKVKVFMILSGELIQHIVPLIHDITQLDCIYILCGNKICYEQWTKEWPKIKGVFIDITPICKVLGEATQECEQDATGISFMSTSDTSASNKQLSSFSKDAIPRRRRPNSSREQNILLIWLDNNIDAEHIDECCNTITQLHRVVDSVNKFTDCDECIDFLTDIHKVKVFMILFGELIQHIVPLIHDITQLDCIYILCGNKICHEQWTKEWPKIKGVFTDVTPICKVLDEAVEECTNNAIGISFMSTSDTGASNRNLDQLDPSFMYTQILKEILLTIQFEEQHIKEYINYCREVFANNNYKLNKVNNFERKYREETPIWWYTSDSFLYPMLNRALRTMDVDIIIKMGFFIRHLHQHIEQLHSEQFSGHQAPQVLTVYRGQSLSKTDFDQLVKTKGGLMSFNCFLSTSKKREISLTFAHKALLDSDIVEILFAMTIDPSQSTTPFASINEVSCFQEQEDEVLFSMHTVFRIHDIKQIGETNRLWQVDLTLTSENDQELRAVTESMRKEVPPYGTGWQRLGILLLKMGQWEKAQQVYEVMLEQAIDDHEKAIIYHQLGCTKQDLGEYEEALTFHKKSHEILQKILPTNHSDLAKSYDMIGSVYKSMGEDSKALSYFEKALEIGRKSLPSNHPDLAKSYVNIGLVYNSIGEDSKALSYYEKALEIRQKSLPSNHPDFAQSYVNIGSVYDNMGEYSKALAYYERSLEIQQKSLPANHPDLTASYNNIGLVYKNMGEYSKALSYYDKSLEIQQKSLSSNHPDLAKSYVNIGLVYNSVREDPKALSYFEKSLEIQQKSLPANHPDLAQPYNNIGGVYCNMGEYSKAVSYFEKALKIRQKSLPSNHPDLGASYNNIGGAYCNMGEYSKAVSYFEKALEIRQKSLPSNHPDLGDSYNNIGAVYFIMGEYSKAFSYYERDLEIKQKSLPSNHPDLASTYNNIGMVYGEIGEYSKALSSHEKALEIQQKSLPPNHPDLGGSYNSIGMVYKNMGEYSKAFSYYKRAVDIGEHSLSSNHPHLQRYRKNLDLVKKKL